MQKLLLDSHALLWTLFEPKRVRCSTLETIANPKNHVYVSIVSLWELAIKANLNKLPLPEAFHSYLEPAGYRLLPLGVEHLETYRSLPLLHRDPFDRMLVAQAIAEGLTILTRDPDIRRYPVASMEA